MAKHGMAGMRPALIVMAKAAELGRVKTRLGAEVGPVQATRFYRSNVAAVLGRLGADPRWRLHIAVAPDVACDGRRWQQLAGRNRRLPERLPQGRGDLGVRMQRLLELPAAGPVVIIGTDVPEIRPDHIAAAFRLARRSGIVFGPAPDGGFWLVGQSRVPKALCAFGAVRWSAAETLADCLRNLHGRPAGFAATLADIDTAADLARVSPWIGRRILPWHAGR